MFSETSKRSTCSNMDNDERLKTLIENCRKTDGRSVVVVLGTNAEKQVPNLCNLAFIKEHTVSGSVNWYISDTDRGSKKEKKSCKLPEKFFDTLAIRRIEYKNSRDFLGSSCRICVFQNFEAITPNILAQGIETVQAGGMVIFLLEHINSLNELLKTKMDLHGRLRSPSGMGAMPRFTERFLISLTRCRSCVVVDDQLRVLSHSESSYCLWSLKPSDVMEHSKKEQADVQELSETLLSQSETSVAGSLVKCCATMDQAKAVLAMIGAITNKSLPSTLVVTAARGRGKSAALGLGMAAAIAYKFGDVYITAPSPENISTVYEYIEIGLRALDFKDSEFRRISASPASKQCHGFEVYRDHIQKVEYVRPEDHRLISGAKFLCIDEAAAIPTTYVKEMMSARYVFMTSTVNGYEGTGRALSHKLISDLRQKVLVRETGVEVAKTVDKIKKNVADDFNEMGNRVLHEIELLAPVRYGPQDLVEPWLNGLLCLNTGGDHASRECPYPSSCELYYVNKDTLFSGHEKTEEFLQELVSVFAASHYKNTPNDVMMLSDAPNHHVFCLLGPSVKTSDKPTILCAIQVAYEGGVDQKTVSSALRRGTRGDGDLIPWIIEEKYRGRGFAQKMGVRVVRIATHPGLQRGGYGSRAMELLSKYYEGRLMDLEMKEENIRNMTACELAAAHSERIKPRSNLPPLMVELGKRRPERMDYMGASFGLTAPLLRFWKKQGMVTVCVSLAKNALTGDYNGIVLKPINRVEDDVIEMEEEDESRHEKSKGVVLPSWLMGILRDFQQTFLDSLTDVFRELETGLALEVLKNVHVNMTTTALGKEEEEEKDSSKYFVEDDDILLDHFMKDMCSEKQISTLVYLLAHSLFSGKLGLKLTELKEIIFLGMGIQRKSVEEMAADLPNTDAKEREAFYKQAIRACIMKKSGEDCPDDNNEDEEEEKKKKESMKEKLDLVQQLRDDMEDAIEVGRQRHKALEEFKVSDLKVFAIGGQKDDLWTKEVEKVGKKSKSNILKRKAGDESELVKNMKKRKTGRKAKK